MICASCEAPSLPRPTLEDKIASTRHNLVTSGTHLKYLSCSGSCSTTSPQVSNWLAAPCSAPNSCDGVDLDQSGTVDLGDFTDLADTWLDCTAPNLSCD